MNLLLQILIAAYELGFLPMAAGSMITFLRNRKINPFSYVLGYFVLFAAFWLLAVPMQCLRMPLRDMLLVWKIFSVGIGVVFFVFCACNLAELREWVLKTWEYVRHWEVERSLPVVFCVVAMLGAVVWVTPSREDNTAEVAAIMADTETVYAYQPYTLEPYGQFPNEKVFSPLELFYVINAELAGVDTTEFIHLFLPFFMLPVVFAVYWQVGDYFWPGCGEKKGLFVVFVTIFYSIAAYSTKSLMVGAIQNVWNGTSFAAACIFPMMMIQSFLLVEGAGRRKSETLWNLFLILLCVVAGQLLFADAIMVNGVIFACSVVAKLTKRYLVHDRNN